MEGFQDILPSSQQRSLRLDDSGPTAQNIRREKQVSTYPHRKGIQSFCTAAVSAPAALSPTLALECGPQHHRHCLSVPWHFECTRPYFKTFANAEEYIRKLRRTTALLITLKTISEETATSWNHRLEGNFAIKKIGGCCFRRQTVKSKAGRQRDTQTQPGSCSIQVNAET